MQQRDNWMKKSIQVKKVNRNKTQANRNSNHLGHLKVRRKQTRMETKEYLKSHPKKAINPEISNRNKTQKKKNSNKQGKIKKKRKQTRIETKEYHKNHPKKAINPEISNSHTKSMERTGVAKKTNSNHQRKRKKLHPKRHLKKSFIMMC